MKFKSISNYLSLVKISHTIFALPFAFIGFFLAVKTSYSHFDYKLLIFVVLCMLFARNTAMSFNRYIDRHFDSLNPRTVMREIPAEILKPKSVLVFTIINSLLFIATTFFINKLCFFLSPIALFVIMGYSYTKRFTALCHVILGLGLSFAPIGAYIAVTNMFDLLPILFSAIVLFWVAGFDIIYALLDVEFDQTYKLNSIPSKLGYKKGIFLSLIFHFITICLVIYAGYLGSFGLFYFIGALAFILLLIYQHIIVKPDNLKRINLAFATLNGIASIIFAVFVILDIFF